MSNWLINRIRHRLTLSPPPPHQVPDRARQRQAARLYGGPSR